MVTWPPVYKFHSCSSQQSMKYQFATKSKMLKRKVFSCFKTLRWCIYPVDKCCNANNCWHFNIYEQDKHAQFKEHEKRFITSGSGSITVLLHHKNYLLSNWVRSNIFRGQNNSAPFTELAMSLIAPHISLTFSTDLPVFWVLRCPGNYFWINL